MAVVKKLPEINILMQMAAKEPERLERLRQTLVTLIIDDADEAQQQRLKGLQFRIDMVRRRASNPMSACLTLWSMMCDSLGSMNRAFAGEYDPTERPAAKVVNLHAAKVPEQPEKL